MKKVKPLSGRGKDIVYVINLEDTSVQWGGLEFTFQNHLYDEIINNFMHEPNAWYYLGASMTKPIVNGLGVFICSFNDKLTPRHASAIAAIMHNENMISFRGNKPIELKKLI